MVGAPTQGGLVGSRAGLNSISAVADDPLLMTAAHTTCARAGAPSPTQSRQQIPDVPPLLRWSATCRQPAGPCMSGGAALAGPARVRAQSNSAQGRARQLPGSWATCAVAEKGKPAASCAPVHRVAIGPPTHPRAAVQQSRPRLTRPPASSSVAACALNCMHGRRDTCTLPTPAAWPCRAAAGRSPHTLASRDVTDWHAAIDTACCVPPVMPHQGMHLQAER